MAGIRSIGWWIPEGRRTAQQIADDYGLTKAAIDEIGLQSHAVAGADDHPSTMGASAARKALAAASLEVDDIDLMIYSGATRDYPSPWVASLGVLHELGANRAAGFDISNHCNGGIDALWIAKTLVESGSHKTVAVCFAERYDYLLGPPRAPELVTDVVFSAGAACAIVTADAGNDITAYSGQTNPDLSVHAIRCPLAGGTRQPIDEAVLRDGLHLWKNSVVLQDIPAIKRFASSAQQDNVKSVCQQAGFDEIDFISISHIHVGQMQEELRQLNISPDKTILPLPFIGHVGAVDLLLELGIATALGRDMGQRIVMEMTTPMYANAIAIRSNGLAPDIAVAGSGLDLALFG